MQWTLQDWQHEYNAIPWTYPIEENNSPIYYDQFIKLRDTLIYSNKIYADNAWRSLIIWTKLDWTPTDTIEIWKPNIVRLDFQPTWVITPYVTWDYVTTWGHQGKTCEILKKWRYKIQHKEQFNNIDSGITRIHTYVVQHKVDWTTQDRAVYDWEWNTWWEIIRMTAFGYVECDLDAWERLELKIEDQNGNDITSETANNSNWRMVEYIDLAYNI